MRLSKCFLPLLKETPAEAQIVSHRLMLRAGMIHQQAAGIYTWLPLGLRVLDKSICKMLALVFRFLTLLVVVSFISSCASRPSFIKYANGNRVVVGYDPYSPQPTDSVAAGYCAQLNKRSVYIGNPNDPNQDRPFGNNSYEDHYTCIDQSGNMGSRTCSTTRTLSGNNVDCY